MTQKEGRIENGVNSTHELAQQVLRRIKPKLLINNEFVDSLTGKTFNTLDPRTGEVLVEVAEAQAEDVDRAVQAAKKAFDEGPWPRMSGKERAKAMMNLVQLLEQHAEDLCVIEALDSGKPLSQIRSADVPESIEHFRFYSGYCDKIYGDTLPVSKDFTAYTLKEPIGVAGQIIPWNFPLLMAAWKLAPAIACGCCVVLKVSQYTPLSALLVGELAVEAGIPPGVINILPGKGAVCGDAITKHPAVDKVAFTGSTSVGIKIMQGAAEHIKPVTLELGGNSPVVVCPDADIQQAAEGAHFALFFNIGECCTSGARTYVHESIYDEFVKKSVELAKARKTGDPLDDSMQQGPLVSKKQLEKVLDYIKKGQEEGAKLECGGNHIGDKNGYLVEPTVFSNVTDDMAICRDEIFGPVQVILKWSDIDEVIQRANDTEYGLAASVWTNNLDSMQALTRGIKAGTVWVNCHHQLDAGVPFGGYKMSGFGREHGVDVLHHYTQTKSVYVPLPKHKSWQIM